MSLRIAKARKLVEGEPTPGEWSVFSRRGDGLVTEIVSGVNRHGDGPRWSIVRARTGIRPEDARLMLAAKDLLEALKLILANDGSGQVFDALRLSDARRKARAAIAKAEGEDR